MESPIRKVRKQKGMSLRELAATVGLSPGHLSKLERGLYPIPREAAQRLANALGMVTSAQPKTHSRSHRSSDLPRAFGYRPTKPPVPTLNVAYREALYQEPGPTLLRALDAQARSASFWRAVKLLPRECNGPEQTVLLHLLTPDAQLHKIHPHKLNLSCPVVQPPRRAWWAVVFKAAGLLVAVLPQVKIEARPTYHPQLDFLAAVRRGGRCALADVEVDGPHHQPRRDQERDQAVRKVGVVPLRFSLADVRRPDFRELLLDRLQGLRD